jgi:regulation of enolase protein 1 (concanavalin A-like superfamily)
MTDTVQLTALPMPLRWQVPPSRCHIGGGGDLELLAQAKTDLFVDPAGGGRPALTAPRLLGAPPAGDFTLSARVSVRFAETFDAGVLLVWVSDDVWAKLCFERSPQGPPMVVSVVTRGASDDANGFTVDGSVLWLRVARVGPAWAFHASTDGSYWHFVRHFALPGDRATGSAEDSAAALVGFEAQSPLGAGCAVTFGEITFTEGRLTDLRSGG